MLTEFALRCELGHELGLEPRASTSHHLRGPPRTWGEELVAENTVLSTRVGKGKGAPYHRLCKGNGYEIISPVTGYSTALFSAVTFGCIRFTSAIGQVYITAR